MHSTADLDEAITLTNHLREAVTAAPSTPCGTNLHHGMRTRKHYRLASIRKSS